MGHKNSFLSLKESYKIEFPKNINFSSFETEILIKNAALGILCLVLSA